MKYIFSSLIVLGTMLMAFKPATVSPPFSGAWERVDEASGNKIVVMIGNSHYMAAMYAEEPAKFLGTLGGTFSAEGNSFVAHVEFNSMDSSQIGQDISWEFDLEGDMLKAKHLKSGEVQEYKRIDQGNETDLVGAWRISGRMRNGEMQEMKWGARKTIKMITGTRFQWVAFNPETKMFGGTGGGTYSLEKGTYTEHIEFFSRDDSRVGASLEFQAKVSGKEWDHSGLSSKGAPIREIWKNVD